MRFDNLALQVAPSPPATPEGRGAQRSGCPAGRATFLNAWFGWLMLIA
jgi:hypothetical protein